MLKNLSSLLILLCVLIGGASSVHAEQSAPKSWWITPKAGFSAFSGIAGLEVQYNHAAFDLGYPLTGSVRYYFRPQRHSWFAGLYGTGWGYDHDETKDGVVYTHFSYIQGGAGAGYRWLWHSRWSVELGLAVGAGQNHWANSSAERTDNAVFISPIAALGVSF